MEHEYIVGPEERILITGATGFIGPRVVRNLLDRGFRNLLCAVRASSDTTRLEAFIGSRAPGTHVDIMRCNLFAPADCAAVTHDAPLIVHLAAGGSDKSFADAVMNSVVTTRNLLEACLQNRGLKRFVNVSSLAVYSNKQNRRLLDETCPVEDRPELRGDPYCFAKIKQDQMVIEYGNRGLPYVLLRPGYVYGPGKNGIPARVGVSTFGVFLHLGGSNKIPLTYVDNCAEAIALAGLQKLHNGEVFNVVDDDLPSSRQFLRSYKQNVIPFASAYVPHPASYVLCRFWEAYSNWSDGQLPPVFNRRRWFTYWRSVDYSNEKVKARLGWIPRVSTTEGLKRYFDSCKKGGANCA